MRTIVLSLLLGCAAPRAAMQLRRVVLYQNGMGYFERTGHVGGDTLKLELARGELDDVLKTLTVIDRLGAGVATVAVPTLRDGDRTIALGVRLSAGRAHDVAVSYAVPTPTWKATYRVVLDDHHGLLQGWAMVNNVSQEDWNRVSLTLATGAPMSFALDLHTPEFVRRPDATGHLVAPTVLGPIGNETVSSDGDGIVDAPDRCPDAPAGADDADGCPDNGRVVVQTTSLQVLDLIHFGRGDAIAAPSPTLDAIAETLRANPSITKVEIGGFASGDEAEPWGLASRRAAAVRAALIARGVDGERLAIAPFGATRTLGAGPEKDRRVEFRIVARAADEPRLDTTTARASVHTATTPASVAGSVRYVLGEPVSIPHGAATMVSILNTPVTADDVLLFRPDRNAPGSDRHPFRAIRLANDSGFTLEPGAIAIFARGTFVGDSLLDRLELGQTAWIPYALEGATTVTTKTDADERPVKIVAIHRGVITVENAGVRVTHYTIAAGHEPAAKLYIRHAKTAGYATTDLPPGTQDQGDAYLVPVALQAGKQIAIAIEEREPRRRTIQLLDAHATQLGLYVDGSRLPAEVTEKLATALAVRKEMGAIEDDLEATRGRVGDLATRAEEVRASLRTLDKVRGADDLRKKLVASLTTATADADALARSLGAKTEALAAARGRLQDAMREVTLDAAP